MKWGQERRLQIQNRNTIGTIQQWLAAGERLLQELSDSPKLQAALLRDLTSHRNRLRYLKAGDRAPQTNSHSRAATAPYTQGTQ